MLRPGELITSIVVPRSDAARHSRYLKVRDRASYAFAVASAAVGLRTQAGIVTAARIAIGGTTTRPWRCSAAEESLRGSPLTAETARRAGELAYESARGPATRIEVGIRTVVQALLSLGEESAS
ncbi:FAD binding domain-containing protein [Saccharopolyspora phatthalungensis]|uniref:CO/xanthine dehydrogenase FAD-binding subunit n=1 Tax=Saccharopolyspora phatthalungensis TaxID=664693 RepID=A0A840QHF6_9PSEU|nr:hypothetical protein [Saccharopolyspora phatthalungensis]MBB5159591.1 CO/xanthine dehydrogenase FAD-binding subunit [Saccharopolyspora phatthalungensis]